MRHFFTSLLFCLSLSTIVQSGALDARQFESPLATTISEFASTESAPGNQQAPESDATISLPLQPRSQAGQFLHSLQLNPEYVVVCEFLPEQNSARHYKNLINPDDILPWFVTQNVSKNPSRLSGWKESSQLYIQLNSDLS